jgi:arylsulfatase A-like enzyme
MCMSNYCPRVQVPTVLDAAAAAGLSVASISSWEAIAAAASHGSSVVVSAGTGWPGRRLLEDRKLEEAVADGDKAKPFPASGGTYRPDRYTAAIALAYVRARRPRLLHVGLGDTDEHGHRDDFAAYSGALRAADAFIGDLADSLDALGLAQSTAMIIVSDHGRADVFREHGPSYPESGRTFVLAFGGAVPKRGDACARRDLWLTDIAPTVSALLGLPPDRSPDVIGQPIEEIVVP